MDAASETKNCISMESILGIGGSMATVTHQQLKDLGLSGSERRKITHQRLAQHRTVGTAKRERRKLDKAPEREMDAAVGLMDGLTMGERSLSMSLTNYSNIPY